MKRLTYIVLALCAVSLFSCNKVEDINNAETRDNGITTFTASMPESPLTKTTMARPSILWAAGDKIRVVGYTEGQDVQQAIFTIKSGQGTKNAVFEIDEGETMGTHTQYFAFYPSTIAIKTSSLPTSLEVNSGLTVNAQAAVEGGFDPSLGIMTAKADADGNLTFTHGVAYLGVEIPDDNITALKITFGKNAAQKRPVYSTENGAITANNSGTAELKAVGTFVKGSYYYLCAIPNTANKMTSVTITYTHNGVDKSRTSTTMANDKLEIGKLYDFGCPPLPVLNPVINASNVNIASTDEGGTITYTVDNEVSGGVLTAAIQGTSTISNLALGTPSSGSLTFTCDANADATAKTATVRLTYTYNSPAETAIKDVIITQVAAGASAKESHVWNFADFTDAQMKSITGLEADAKATAGQTWDFGDGLTMVTNSSSKWNNQTIGTESYKWVATGGKYGSNQKFFKFTTAHVGTVTILYASGGSAERSLTIKANSTETTDSSNVSASTSDMKTVTFSSVAAGTIMLYSNVDNVRIYSISFLED